MELGIPVVLGGVHRFKYAVQWGPALVRASCPTTLNRGRGGEIEIKNEIKIKVRAEKPSDAGGESPAKSGGHSPKI